MKDRKLQVRLTGEQYEELKALAKEEDRSVSEYVRRMIVNFGGVETKAPVSKEKCEQVMSGFDPKSDDPRRTTIKRPADITEQKKKVNAKAEELLKERFKPGVSVDQWGNKRSLAKPGKK